MTKLFLVPKVDTPNRELARVRNLDTMLDGLERKFNKPKPKRVRIVRVVEVTNEFGDFSDDAA